MKYFIKKYVIFLALSSTVACSINSPQAGSEYFNRNSDAAADAKNQEGGKYGSSIQESWTSSSFVILKSSRIELPLQRIELMLMALPMVMGKVRCEPSEMLEIRLVPYKNTQKEVWKARVCEKEIEMETVSTIDDHV